jgi:aminoglycoside 6-adenylyltransferase
MSTIDAAYEKLLDQYICWANSRADIRAVMIVGSRARQDHPADAWADLDIISFSRSPRQYFADSDWMAHFGTVWARASQHTAGGDPEWLVSYAGGLDVDFVFDDFRKIELQMRAMKWLNRLPALSRLIPAKTAAQMQHGRAMAAGVFARGVRVMLDKDGLLARMIGLVGPPPPYHPPSPRDFTGCIERYWLMAGKTAKKIGRGEIMTARSWMDGMYWSGLLPMIEWHAHATRGEDCDTWHAGRFIEEWADPRVRSCLLDTMPAADPLAVRHALLASTALFDWLAQETANHLNFVYPHETTQAVQDYIGSLLAQPVTG